ncbi:MAG: hypothetical protein IPP77_05665 [Bacteroidetes bacterium]|nr:hypothetical protein [Bacteroidota bacterium]
MHPIISYKKDYGNMTKFCFVMLLFFMVGWSSKSLGQSCCCTGAGSNYSILPNLNKNVVGLRWTYSYLYSEKISLNPELNGMRTNINFNTAEFFGRFNLNRLLQLSAFVPVNFVSEQSRISNQKTTGLGDISMMMQFLVLDPLKCHGSKSKHQLRLGVGFKLPSGKHKKEDNNLYSTSVQPGTGSTDFFFNAIYTYRYNDFGMNVSGSYRANTVNSYRFRFGDKLEGGANAFYILKSGSWSFMPAVGIKYLHSFHNYNRGEAVYLSPSEVLSTNFSCDIFYKPLALSLSVQPVAYNYAGVGDVTRKLMLEAGLFYNF